MGPRAAGGGVLEKRILVLIGVAALAAAMHRVGGLRQGGARSQLPAVVMRAETGGSNQLIPWRAVAGGAAQHD